MALFHRSTHDIRRPSAQPAAQQPLTMRSTVADLWANPVGHDALTKILLQLGLGTVWVTNPVVRRLRLSQIKSIAGRHLDAGFFDALLALLNSQTDERPVDDEPATPPLESEKMPSPKPESLTDMAAEGRDDAHRPATTSVSPGTAARSPEEPSGDEPWWKRAVFYQIYPRSFKDSNGDGIGDLGGIVEKLDYLRDLGVDALWLSPIYDSPNDDNGYDIRDYRAIMAKFGTMADFDRLLAGAHERGMRLIMDLVVNHTSDEHQWFQQALRDPQGPYGDFYLFRDGTPDSPPNNWTSFFSGSAWRYFPEREQWGLHLFSSKQMDLNWDNPALRREVVDMVRWWLDKGVDGFRLDVINYISKQAELPDGDGTIAQLIGFNGIENYFYGPHLHEYLRQLRTEAFEPYDAFSVGETPGVGLDMAALLTGRDRHELDMVFNFDHLEMPGKTRFDDYRYDLDYLKHYLIDWATDYPSSCWMSLFYDNHDNPRWVSKVEPNGAYRTVLAKLLAVVQLTSRGTPFLFQGQELGMVNQRFSSIDDLRDIESINLFHELVAGGMSHTDAFAKVLAGTRDHARTPVQWTAGPHAGFSDVEPWISGDGDERDGWNAADEATNPGSVLAFYRTMTALRREHPALTDGTVAFVAPRRSHYFGYIRACDDERLFIECNLSRAPLRREPVPGGFTLLASTYDQLTLDGNLRPYEANVYQA